MPDPVAVVALHVAAIVPSCLHDNAVACDRRVFWRVETVADVHGVHHVPDLTQSKVPLLVASRWHPLTFSGKRLNINILVPPVVKRLPHAFEKLMAFVQDEKQIVGILNGLYHRADQLLVARPSSLCSAAVILLCQRLPSRLSVSRSVLSPFAFEFLDNVVGRTRCGKKNECSRDLDLPVSTFDRQRC